MTSHDGLAHGAAAWSPSWRPPALAGGAMVTTVQPAYAADESISVNFSAASGSATYRASGWIYEMTENGANPPDRFFTGVNIWNEPNITLFWNRPQSQDFELWCRTYQRIPAAFPSHLIVGPSLAGVPSTGGWWVQYLDFVKSTNTIPDIVSRHALPGDPVANFFAGRATWRPTASAPPTAQRSFPGPCNGQSDQRWSLS